MNSETVIIVARQEEVEFSNSEGEKITTENLSSFKKIYLVLPDRAFFFFQTEIVAKRPKRAVEAFAKSNFPQNWSFTGYVKDTFPVIGYLFFKDRVPQKIHELLARADIITTPFRISWVKKKDNFLYKGDKISACIKEGKLIFYGPEKDPKCTDADVIELKDTKQIITSLLETLNDPKAKDSLHLDVGEKKNPLSLLKPYMDTITVCSLAIIMTVSGSFLRYRAHAVRIQHLQKSIEDIYKKVFGPKLPTDPYGMLLFKAQKGSKSSSLSPLKLLYLLSKAGDPGDITVERLSISKNTGVKIEGSCANYNVLVDYVKRINQLITECPITIESTSQKRDKLRFTLRCSKKG